MHPSMNIIHIALGTGPVVMVVLFSLVAISIACWTVIFAKILHFRRIREGDSFFSGVFWDSPSFGAIRRSAEEVENSPMARIFMEAHDEYLKIKKGLGKERASRNVDRCMEVVGRAVEAGVEDEMAYMHKALPFLATTGNAAPFIGLFGTVWGILNSFHQIGLAGSASLATVAPGIAEALIATAAGLAAAIPAVVAFNMFTSALEAKEQELRSFAAEVMNTMELQLLKDGEG